MFKITWRRLVSLCAFIATLAVVLSMAGTTRVHKTHAAGGVSFTSVSIQVSGQTLQAGGSISLNNTAQATAGGTSIRGEIVGDGSTIDYQVPIAISNVGADSTGSFGPDGTSASYKGGPVFNEQTGDQIGLIKQTGNFGWDDTPATSSYAGNFILTLDKPIAAGSKIAFQVNLAGSGVLNAKSSSNPMVVTFDNKFNYTINPSQRDLNTPNKSDFTAGSVGINGNQGYVYLGSMTDYPNFYNGLLAAAKYQSEHPTSEPMNGKVNLGDMNNGPVISASIGYGVPYQGPMIVAQTVKSTQGSAIASIEFGNQGTHTLRISGDSATGSNPVDSAHIIPYSGLFPYTPISGSNYILTWNGNADLDHGIESTIAPVQIAASDNMNQQQLADLLASQSGATQGNTYAMSKQSDGSFVVAFNYGNLWTRSGFNAATYFNNKVATVSDGVQESDRSNDTLLDQYLGTNSPLTFSDSRLSNQSYQGQIMNNFENMKVVFENPDIVSTAEVSLIPYIGNGTTADSTLAMMTNDNMPNTAKATNNPSDGLLAGQTVVNVYYVTEDGTQLTNATGQTIQPATQSGAKQRHVGYPQGQTLVTPDAPFANYAPKTLTDTDGTIWYRVDRGLNSVALGTRYGIGGRQLWNDQNSLSYPEADSSGSAISNYYYVYTKTKPTVPETNLTLTKYGDATRTNPPVLAGARYILTTYAPEQLATLAQQRQDALAAGDSAKAQDLLTQMQSYAVLNSSDSLGVNTDDYSKVWTQITNNQTDTAYDLNGDGKVNDDDKNQWIKSDPSTLSTPEKPNLLIGTTDANGQANFSHLALGDNGADKKYYLVEIDPPAGYLISEYAVNSNKAVTLTKSNTTTSPRTTSAYDKPAPKTDNKLTVIKTDQNDMSKLLPGAQFVLTTYQYGAEQLSQLATALQSATSDSVRKQIMTEMRKYGVLDSANSTYGTNTDDYSAIWNNLIDGTGTTYDLNGDGTVDDADKTLWLSSQSTSASRYVPNILVGTTGSDGKVDFSKLAMTADGSSKSYYVVEIKAPNGYVLNNPDFSTVQPQASLSSTKLTDSVTVNDVSTLLTVDKRSAKDGNTLTGAEFKIYDANHQQVTTDANGNTIGDNGTLTTTGSDGNYKQISVSGLPLGNYTLVETKAPAGHELLMSKVPFTISLLNNQVHLDLTDAPQTTLPYAGGDNSHLIMTAILVAAMIAIGGSFAGYRYWQRRQA